MSSGSEAEGGGDDLRDHPILQFLEGSVGVGRCAKFRTMKIDQQKIFDRDILTEIGEWERTERWISEETPWRRLFDMTFEPSFKAVTVDFLSTFTYLPAAMPEVAFSMLRQQHKMSLVEFIVLPGLYWEPETVTPLYTTGITEIDDATLRAWWPHIAEDAFIGTKARLIATSIAGRSRSREWCTLQDLFYLYCLITGRTCQLVCCLAEYFATYYYQQQCRLIYGCAYITIIGRTLGHLHQDTLEELSDHVDPVRLDHRTPFGMKIIQDFLGVGLRFSLLQRVI
ncbi:hypothetical protein R6Q57_019586 [Mikania cordata]